MEQAGTDLARTSRESRLVGTYIPIGTYLHFSYKPFRVEAPSLGVGTYTPNFKKHSLRFNWLTCTNNLREKFRRNVYKFGRAKLSIIKIGSSTLRRNGNVSAYSGSLALSPTPAQWGGVALERIVRKTRLQSKSRAKGGIIQE
jgi:hypothetical protein